jgi:hypothetical protein
MSSLLFGFLLTGADLSQNSLAMVKQPLTSSRNDFARSCRMARVPSVRLEVPETAS